MSEKLQRDQALLEEAQRRGGLALFGTYFRMSGPGWLQSALTLGGGSLAGSLFLGVIGGYEMLWVQPLAMILGVIMLGAISYVTLSIESSPFHGIRRHINPVLAWGWLLGALLANMVWALPQYSLAYAALADNLFPDWVARHDSLGLKMMVSTIVLAIVTAITLGYSNQGRGVRVYEWSLKILVGIVVISFAGVAVRLTTTGELPWGTILLSLIPNPKHLFEPTSGFQDALKTISDPAARSYWREMVLAAQHERMIAAASAAVGINMTFLMPYALLAKGWNRRFRGLAVFDLSTGLLLPFVLATGCVVVAAASQFHTKGYEGLLIQGDGSVEVDPSAPVELIPALESSRGALEGMLQMRQAAPGLGDVAITPQEATVASMLLPRDTRELATALEGLFGSAFVAQTVFGIGVMAMALSTISLLMLISGFAVCEALGVERKGRPFQLGIFCAATGVFWPLVWTGTSKAYLAVVIGTIGYTLIPVALITFLFMLNSKRLMKEAMPTKGTRWTWNLLMGTALAITGSASVWTAWNKRLGDFPIGPVLLVTFLVLVIAGHLLHTKKLHSESIIDETT